MGHRGRRPGTGGDVADATGHDLAAANRMQTEFWLANDLDYDHNHNPWWIYQNALLLLEVVRLNWWK